MNRILTGLIVFFIVCFSGICFGNDKADGEREPQNSQDQTEKTKKVKKKVGPFEIGKKSIIVILDITEYEGHPYLYHSFEIVDEAGVSHYKKELGSTPESSTAIEEVYKLEGKNGEGLIIYFDTEPNAPPAGKSFQIFGVEKGKVKPLSQPVNVYGQIQSLQKGKSQGAIRLFDDHLMKVEIWKDFFGIVIPLAVDLKKLKIAPLITKGIFNLNIGYTPSVPGTFNRSEIKLYENHSINSNLSMLPYQNVKKVQFIYAYADVQLDNRGDIYVSNIWLKIKINGREGWVNDVDSFVTLGLRPMS